MIMNERPYHEMNPTAIRVIKSSIIISAAIAAIALVVIAGWIFDCIYLKSINPGFVSMKPNSAVGFVLAAISIFFLADFHSRRKLFNGISVTASVLLFCIGLFTVLEYFFFWDLTAFDLFLFRDNTSTVMTSHPGRMSISAAFEFLFLGLALLLIRSKRPWLFIPSHILLILIFLNALVFFLGYFYGINPVLKGLRYSTAMSIHECFLFLVACVAAVNSRPEIGVTRVLSSGETGGKLLRFFMSVSLPIPLLIGYFRSISIETGLMDDRQGITFVSVANLAMISLVLFIFAVRLNRSESSRMIADSLLKSSEARYRRLFETANSGIMILDISTGRVEDINPFLSSILDMEKNDFLNRFIWEIGPFRNIPAIMGFYNKLRTENRAILDDLPLITSAGRNINVELSGNIYEVDGVKVAQCSVRDITDHMRMENELRKNESYFRAVVENSFDGFVLLNSDLEATYISPSYLRMIGFRQDEIVGKYSVSFIHPDDRDTVSQKVEKILASPGSTESATIRLLHKDGHYIWVEITTVNLLNDRHVHSLVLHIRDISERVSAEEKLVQMNEQLEEKVRQTVSELRDKDQMMILQSRQAAMGEMLGNIAHQWRQPLNAIGILVQNLIEHDNAGLLDRPYLEKNVKKSMDLIFHMSETIDDFRNFFRPNKEKSLFNLKESVESSMSFVSASFRDYGVQVTLEGPDDARVTGYPNEFSQVLLNIFNNALDAIRERKTADPRVRVVIRKERDKAVLTIADNAGGIAEKIMDKVFEPYFTTKEMGTGIGLYMAKTIIEKNMGGRITAANNGEGAEFRIEI